MNSRIIKYNTSLVNWSEFYHCYVRYPQINPQTDIMYFYVNKHYTIGLLRQNHTNAAPISHSSSSYNLVITIQLCIGNFQGRRLNDVFV